MIRKILYLWLEVIWPLPKQRKSWQPRYNRFTSARSQKISVVIGFVGGQNSSNLKSILPIMRGTQCFRHSIRLTSNARILLAKSQSHYSAAIKTKIAYAIF